jgi:hypothetical protein
MIFLDVFCRHWLPLLLAPAVNTWTRTAEAFVTPAYSVSTRTIIQCPYHSGSSFTQSIRKEDKERKPKVGSSHVGAKNTADSEETLKQRQQLPVFLSRRSIIKKAATILGTATTAAVVFPALVANAEGPELDTTSGERFIPKSDCPCMDLKREVTDEDRRIKKTAAVTSKGLLQNVYNVRFITYLSRFLLNYDPAARAWFQVRI